MAKYTFLECSSSGPVVVTGRFLAHNHLDMNGRSFLAAGLNMGLIRPDQLTLKQSALLARVNVTYAGYAAKRWEQRADIQAGLIPLVPGRVTNGNGNGNGYVAPVAMIEAIDDISAKLDAIGHAYGPDVLLAAAVRVEHEMNLTT
jgi:hypothetical protein